MRYRRYWQLFRVRRPSRARAGGQCRRRCASIAVVCCLARRSPLKTSRTNDDTDYLE